MKRLKQMLRRKAGQVAPEPAGSSVRLAREESGPSVPAGGEEACGQANRRSSLNCWRKRKTPAPLAGPEAPPGPKWRWPRVMLCRRDPGEGGSRARWLCGFLYRKQRSQEPSPRAQQEPSTSLVTEEPPAGPEQELGDSGMGARSSTYSRGASSPSVGSDSPEAEGSLFAETPSAQLKEAEEEEDVSPEQDTMRIIQWHLQGRAELVENRAKQLRFLHAVPRLCFLAQQQGRDTLEPHISRAALVESIAELIENLPMVPEPTSIISSSMAAVCSLSKLKPPLALELESRLLRALLYTIFTRGTGQDATHFRALHNTYLQGLDTMLGCPLTETPTTDKLQHLLEHVHFWLQSKNTQERARAIRSSAALFQFATSLPGCDTSSNFPKAGNFVLQLGLYISDPANDISQQARSGIRWLQRLLLQRRGLNIQEASDLWCRDGLQDTEHLAYSNMARVGEVFGQIFSEGQRRAFLQAALLAIHDPQIRVSQAGLVLTYSILGEAGQLIGDEQEDVTATIMAHLFYIRCLRQVPKALQGLCAVGHL